MTTNSLTWTRSKASQHSMQLLVSKTIIAIRLILFIFNQPTYHRPSTNVRWSLDKCFVDMLPNITISQFNSMIQESYCTNKHKKVVILFRTCKKINYRQYKCQNHTSTTRKLNCAISLVVRIAYCRASNFQIV